MRARPSDILGFLRFVWRRWNEDRCPQIAGSLTYTSLLAVVPLFAVAVSVLSSTAFFETAMAQLKVMLLRNLVPDIAYRIITVYMPQFAQNAERLTWVGIGVVFTIAIMLLLLIERSINAIWRARGSRPLWRSVLAYAVLLAMGPLLIGVGMSITTYLLSLTVTTQGIPREWHDQALRLVPVSLTAIAFFLLYVIVPHRRVPWRHAAIGGFVAAVLFEAAKELFAYYVRYAPTYNLLYGTFAAVPLFLLWIYISWSVVLLGAELTACLGYWAGRSWRHERTAGARFRAAVSLARILIASYPGPAPVSDLRRDTSLPVQEIEDTLAHLAEAGITRREGRWAYSLSRSPEKVSFGDLYRAAVGPIGGMSPQEWADVSPEFERAAAQMEQGLARPIATLAGNAPERKLRTAKRGRARNGRSSR